VHYVLTLCMSYIWSTKTEQVRKSIN
jgi:hypothetical protein